MPAKKEQLSQFQKYFLRQALADDYYEYEKLDSGISRTRSVEAPLMLLSVEPITLIEDTEFCFIAGVAMRMSDLSDILAEYVAKLAKSSVSMNFDCGKLCVRLRGTRSETAQEFADRLKAIAKWKKEFDKSFE